tara:strand:- start:44 stop:481 length:438 start_codon:yes stop_codon:yes gene_type:complete
MKRVKSAPANIAEMVNRKKPNLKKKSITSLPIIQNIIYKKNNPIVMREQIQPIKNQKNIEKTFNNIMLDYINDKKIYNINDEEAVIASILYFYVSEKIFTKNNLREFILFVVQMFIRYIFTHSLHEIYLTNKDLIDNKILLLQHI